MMNPHLKRWITGIVAVPVLFCVVYFGTEEVFAILILLAALAGVFEYGAIVFGAGKGRERGELFFFGAVLLLAAAAGDRELLLAVVALSVPGVFILDLFSARTGSFDMGATAKTVLGIVYVPLLMSHFIFLRREEQGVLWIFFVLVLAFSGDIAAFYVGRKFGRRKLLPSVSPGKTVEGILGLVAGSLAGCLLFRWLFFPVLPVLHAAVLAAVGGIVGQLGDLSESALKRSAGVKDSGAILPGHGGILDRLDCLLFLVPFVYYYQRFVIP
ncbi:MAG: Phosphatidate cytidylyltransferase [Syntrophaceae bacterium PtaU1.Bin231]|nr:MAG: Phosphatidate cytidylyltransferase [Syntrophaceae bacterium PtaU1.Bin231]